MMDTFSMIGLVLSILIVGCFFVLIIIQFNSYRNKKVENQFFIIALITGMLGICAYISDLIVWETNQCSSRTTNSCLNSKSYLDGLLFFFFTISFYFWFKHYQKIILLNHKKYSFRFDFLKNFDFWSDMGYSLSLIDILFFAGILISLIFYLGYFFNLDSFFNPFWSLINLRNYPGRFVTPLSHITFLSGCIFIYITYIIIKNNLIELQKVTIYELFSITVLGFSEIFLLINDLCITYGIYSLELNNLFVNIGLFTTFISLIILLVDFILLQPTHLQSPSLYKDIAELIKTIENDNFSLTLEKRKEITESTDINNDFIQLDIPQKLNGTGIIILIYLMKNQNAKNLLAKDLETNLKLNKSTISYNLKILENNSFITRKSPFEMTASSESLSDMEIDQRQKRIVINETGKKFLANLQQYLDSIFKIQT